MMFKAFLTLFIFTLSLQAADILRLVGLLDRNDIIAFKSEIRTINDANAMRDDNNKTILMYACWVGNAEAVHHLIQTGADINAQDSGGATALHLAAWKNHTDIALYLLKNGALGNTMSKDGMTPLDIASMKENKEIVEAIEKSAPKLKKLL